MNNLSNTSSASATALFYKNVIDPPTLPLMKLFNIVLC